MFASKAGLGRKYLADSSSSWTLLGTSCLARCLEPVSSSVKVACFDLDGTLINVKSNSTFARSVDDWKWFHASVPEKLQQQHADGYQLVLFTNQKGLPTHGRDASITSPAARVAQVTKKIDDIAALVKVPIRAYVAIADDVYRKPCTGMFRALQDVLPNIDFQKSVYVGDAAGRGADHGDADYGFATNVGLQFYTPEEFFLSQQTDTGKKLLSTSLVHTQSVVERSKQESLFSGAGVVVIKASHPDWFPCIVETSIPSSRIVKKGTSPADVAVQGEKSVVFTPYIPATFQELTQQCKNKGVKLTTVHVTLPDNILKAINIASAHWSRGDIEKIKAKDLKPIMTSHSKSKTANDLVISWKTFLPAETVPTCAKPSKEGNVYSFHKNSVANSSLGEKGMAGTFYDFLYAYIDI